jgi:2-oxoglutarate ferredoxin oxidoreductase subunit alpha
MFAFTVQAFNYAERFRTPTLVMADGAVSYMREPLRIPPAGAVPVINRHRLTVKDPNPENIFLRYEMPRFGDGHNLLITGSAHRPTGLRDYTPKYHRATLQWMFEKSKAAGAAMRQDGLDLDAQHLDDARSVVISYGAAARPSYQAVLDARQAGEPVGFIRLKSLWPFPEAHFLELVKNITRIFVVEMNMGMMVHEVARIACHARVTSIPKVAGEVHHSTEILEQLRRRE